MTNVRNNIKKTTSENFQSVLSAGINLPGKEDLLSEIQYAISSSERVIEAKKELENVGKNKKQIEEQLLKQNQKKFELTRRKRALKPVFGDNPDSDDKELGEIWSEMVKVDDAIKMLTRRLEPDGEQRRLVEDLNSKVEHAIGLALKPLNTKYACIVNKYFNDMLGFLEDYHEANIAAWPRKTEGGVSIRYSTQARIHNKVVITDAVRIADYTDDINTIIKGSMHAGLNQSKAV